jgi:hypothetical protein
MANKIQLRRDTATNWSRINPVLADGEPGLDITNNKIKLGDGTTPWNGLLYLTSSEHNRLVNDTKVLTLGKHGSITIPNAATGKGKISNSSGIGLGVGNSSWTFGTNGEITFPEGSINYGGTVVASGAYDIQSVGATTIRTAANGPGIKTWNFGTDGKLTVPANGVITTVPGYTGTAFNIVDIVQSDPVYPVVITTSVNHGLTSGTKIRISGITTTVELNDQDFYVTTPASNQLELYSDPNCTVPVFGSTNTPYFTAGNRSVTSTGESLAGNNPGFTDRSMQFFGNGYAQTPASTDFNIGTGDFAISFWVYQDSYANNPRLFSFGTWNQTNPLAVSSESSALYFWLNGNIFGYGNPGPALSLNTWHHFLITRFNSTIYLGLDGNVYNQFGNSSDIPSGSVPLVVANQSAHDAGLVGYMRDFKLNVGQGVDLSSGNYTVPSAPATVDTGFTKLLLVDYPSDSSGSGLVGGGGTALSEFAGADLTIALDSPAGTDPGSIYLRSGGTMLSVNGRDDTVGIANPGGSYPFTTTGQETIFIDATTGTNGIGITNVTNNVFLVTQADGYTGTDAQTITLPVPTRAGIEITVINTSGSDVGVVGWPGSPYGMSPGWSIKLISVDLPGLGFIWWVTSNFSW